MAKSFQSPVGYGFGEPGTKAHGRVGSRNSKQKNRYEDSNGNANETAFSKLRERRRVYEGKWPESQGKLR